MSLSVVGLSGDCPRRSPQDRSGWTLIRALAPALSASWTFKPHRG